MSEQSGFWEVFIVLVTVTFAVPQVGFRGIKAAMSLGGGSCFVKFTHSFTWSRHFFSVTGAKAQSGSSSCSLWCVAGLDRRHAGSQGLGI
jgi:hypothetical protein